MEVKYFQNLSEVHSVGALPSGYPKSKNIISPDIYGYYVIGDVVLEISAGYGLNHECNLYATGWYFPKSQDGSKVRVYLLTSLPDLGVLGNIATYDSYAEYVASGGISIPEIKAVVDYFVKNYDSVIQMVESEPKCFYDFV